MQKPKINKYSKWRLLAVGCLIMAKPENYNPGVFCFCWFQTKAIVYLIKVFWSFIKGFFLGLHKTKIFLKQRHDNLYRMLQEIVRKQSALIPKILYLYWSK